MVALPFPSGSFGNVEVERPCKAGWNSQAGPGDRTSAGPRQTSLESDSLGSTLSSATDYLVPLGKSLTSLCLSFLICKMGCCEDSMQSDKCYTSISRCSYCCYHRLGDRHHPHIPSCHAAALPLRAPGPREQRAVNSSYFLINRAFLRSAITWLAVLSKRWMPHLPCLQLYLQTRLCRSQEEAGEEGAGAAFHRP